MKRHKFFDKVKLYVTSGNGGKGNVSFRREKYVPRGMPDGGDGGNGGNIVFKVNPQLNHLAHLKYKRIYKAGNGENGQKRRAFGKSGQDVIIEVPPLTMIKLLENEKVIHEFSEPDEELTLLKGGKGGKGNFHFKSAERQNPTYSQDGLEGSSLDIIVELKLLADIGLVGFPNVGKSTFLNSLTNALSPTGDYHFTTLSPHLGVFYINDYETLLISDIPGLIKGAHQGKGLGITFLKHIEKTSILFFLIDSTSNNPVQDFKDLEEELKFYQAELLEKDIYIILTKTDLIENAEPIKQLFPASLQEKMVAISSKHKTGFSDLKHLLKKIYDKINSKNKPF